MNEDIIKIIIENTNEKGRFKEEWIDVDAVELKAFIGLLIAAGLLHLNHTKIDDLFAQDSPFHVPIFSATMSRTRFKSILSAIRFDDIKTREKRRSTDKLAAIRDVNDLLIKNCISNFIPYEHVTVDEQMIGFKGRCNFRVYMSNKPDRHGIKTWMLCDVNTHYVHNFQIYTGKNGSSIERNLGKRVVLDLIKHLPEGRGATTDNFFTTKLLAHELLKMKLSLIGTIRKNRVEIPKALLPSKNRQINSSIYAFSKEMTLVSYVPKRNKCVMLLSTEHFNVDNSIEDHQKPQIILDYNKTKGSVDSFDQMIKNLTCRRATRRWPFVLFMNFVDISALNSFVIWHTKNNDWKNKRIHFMKTLAHELVKSLIVRRSSNLFGINQPVINDMKKVIEFGEESNAICSKSEQPVIDPSATKDGRCHLCPVGKRKKSRTKCDKCYGFVCNDHKFKIVRCDNCN